MYEKRQRLRCDTGGAYHLREIAHAAAVRLSADDFHQGEHLPLGIRDRQGGAAVGDRFAGGGYVLYGL